MNARSSLINLKALITTWDLDSSNFTSIVHDWIPDNGGDYELIVVGLQNIQTKPLAASDHINPVHLTEIHTDLVPGPTPLSNEDIAALSSAVQGCKGLPVPSCLRDRRMVNDPPVFRSFHKDTRSGNISIPEQCSLFHEIQQRLGNSFKVIVSTIVDDVGLSIFVKLPHANRVRNITVISKRLSLFNILNDSVAIVATFQYENATFGFVTNGSKPVDQSSLRCLQFLDVVNQVRFADQLVDFDAQCNYTFWLGDMDFPKKGNTFVPSSGPSDALLYHRNLGHVFSGWEEVYLSPPPNNWPKSPSTSPRNASSTSVQDITSPPTETLNSSSGRILWKALPAFARLVNVQHYFRLPAKINPIIHIETKDSSDWSKLPLILDLQLSVHSSMHPLASHVVPGDARQLEVTSIQQLRQIILRSMEAVHTNTPKPHIDSSTIQRRYSSMQLQGSPYFGAAPSPRDTPRLDSQPVNHPDIGPLPVSKTMVVNKSMESAASPSVSPVSTSSSFESDPVPPQQTDICHTPNPLAIPRHVDANTPLPVLDTDAFPSHPSANATSGALQAPANCVPNPTRVPTRPVPAMAVSSRWAEPGSQWRVPSMQAPRLVSKSILSQREALAAINDGHIVLPHPRFSNVRAQGILSIDPKFLTSPFLVFLSDRATERGIRRRSYEHDDDYSDDGSDDETYDYDSDGDEDEYEYEDGDDGGDDDDRGDKVGVMEDTGVSINPLHASSGQSTASQQTKSEPTLQDTSSPGVSMNPQTIQLFESDQPQRMSIDDPDSIQNPLRTTIGSGGMDESETTARRLEKVRQMSPAAVRRYVKHLVSRNRQRINNAFRDFPRSEPVCNTLNPAWDDATIDEIAILSTDPEDLSFGHIIIVLVDGLCPEFTRLGQVCLPIAAPLMLDGIPHQFSIPIIKGTRQEGILYGNVELVWRLRPELKFRNVLVKGSKSCCELM